MGRRSGRRDAGDRRDRDSLRPASACVQGRRARRGAVRAGGQAPRAAACSVRSDRGPVRPGALLELHAAGPGRRIRRRLPRPSPEALARSRAYASGPARGPGSLRSQRSAPSWSWISGASLLTTWHDDPWAQGAYSALSVSSPLDSEALARPVGPVAFAGEHTAGAWHGMMEGALRSGRRAAEDVLAR